MSITDEEFFRDNVINVNRMVGIILWSTIAVPVLFLALTLQGFWFIEFKYCINLFVFTLFSSITFKLLDRPNRHFQVVRMYFGILASTIFVDFLGYNGTIALSISFCLPIFISCLYYDRKLTNITSIFTYISVLIVLKFRAPTTLEVINGLRSAHRYFIIHAVGTTTEFIFALLIGNLICSRSFKTLRSLILANDDRLSTLDKLKERNQYIIKINSELETKNKELNQTQFEIIQFIAQVLGSHDLFTGRHVIHTRKYVEIICKELRDEGYYLDELTDENIQLYSTAAFLHDIGKIHIPEGVLNKIGKFTNEEFELMKCHPLEGEKLLNFLPQIEKGKFNTVAKQMALCHHEKWDGSGYPNGISGDDIPLAARIMAAADVLDALISQRLYKDPMTIDEAMDVFEKSKGIHFEPIIADAVIACKPIISIVDRDFKTTESETNSEELEWWKKYHQSLSK